MTRVAIVHDWFDRIAGPEKVVKQMLECYPDADVFSLVDHLDDEQRHYLGIDQIHTSFIQKLPFAKSGIRKYLPLTPLAIEQFDLSNYDLILSSSHSVAKGVLTHCEQLHVSYVHTPIRCAWNAREGVSGRAGLTGRIATWFGRPVSHYLRNWDRSTADRPDVFVANSRFVAARIRKTYNRPAHVIYPPVDVEDLNLQCRKENFYLAAGRMLNYKRFDLVVQAFSKIPEAQLIVIGDGPELRGLKSMAGSNINWLGYQSDGVLRNHLQRAKAFVFAAREDFGIMPVEAQACGTPVIGFGRGGTAESVVHGVTGLHFHEQTVDCLVQSLRDMEEIPVGFFDPHEIRKNAERFGRERFKREFLEFVEARLRYGDSGHEGQRELQLESLGLSVGGSVV